MSIPQWSFAADYYDSLLASRHVEIRTDPVKGKGLFATQDFAEGDEVLRERALCCSQNLDDFNNGIPICTHCLRSLESPADIVTRVINADFVARLPSPILASEAPVRVPCRRASKCCKALYCSERCEAQGWERYHSVSCLDLASDDAKAAFARFASESWIQGGIDLSDTHFVALRFMAFAIARHRSGIEITEAYAPVAQLIRAPITKFAFTYLVVDEFETEGAVPPSDETAAQAKKRRWDHFCKYKDDQSKDPIVKFANRGVVSKAAMLSLGISLLATIFNFTPEEREFMTVTVWSELLGAVLLNGQERSPNSPYVEHMARVKASDKQAAQTFVKLVKAKGKDTKLAGSSRGQGVYPVGACFNHSCSPNIQVSYVDENNETLVVHTLRPVVAGEELCISYIDENESFEVRQQHLFEHYLFTCTCVKCAQGPKRK